MSDLRFTTMPGEGLVPAARGDAGHGEVLHLRCAEPGDRWDWAPGDIVCAVCGEPVSSADEAECALYARSWTGRAELTKIRAWLAGCLAGCPMADDIVLCGSEISANAMQWTRSGWPGGRIQVWLALAPGAWAAVEVRDHGGAARPVVRHPGPGATGGRGLELVEGLASMWGTDGSDPQSRRVWARFDLPPCAAAAASALAVAR